MGTTEMGIVIANWRRRVLLFSGAILGLLALWPAAAHAGTLDQQQTSTGQLAGVTEPDHAAQTFTAGLGGQLDQVDLALSRIGAPADLIVEIRNVNSGEPGSTVLGSATVAAASVPSELSWVSVPISAPSVAGTQYAIVLSSPGSPFDCDPGCYGWGVQGGNPYSGGALYQSSNSGANWGVTTHDAAFKTYVAESACATPPVQFQAQDYPATILGDSPAAYWRLGESSGTVADDEVGTNDGTYTGNLTLGVPGAIAGDPDTAADFSPDAKSRVPTTYPHAAFGQGAVRSFEGWACRTENKGFDTFFSGDKRKNSPGLWTDHGDLDRIWFDPRREGGAGPRFWDGVMPADGDWFHWVLIFDDPANTAELFIDGASQGARTVTEPPHSSPGNFQIGNYAQINEAWNGRLDEIAVYERELTLGEICVHHLAGFGATDCVAP